MKGRNVMQHLEKQKIVIAGGTGFVGQGIIKALSPDLFDIHSLSRHGFKPGLIDHATYHAVDLSQPDQWQHIAANADWVIDAVGILLPNPIKKQNYHNSSYQPAKNIIDVLIREPKPKFLFISANSGPFFMKPYLNAKYAVEKEMTERLPNRSYSVYPGIIFDKARKSSYIPGIILTHLTWINYFKQLRPVSRDFFAQEIYHIVLNKQSVLMHRTVHHE